MLDVCGQEIRVNDYVMYACFVAKSTAGLKFGRVFEVKDGQIRLNGVSIQRKVDANNPDKYIMSTGVTRLVDGDKIKVLTPSELPDAALQLLEAV